MQHLTALVGTAHAAITSRVGHPKLVPTSGCLRLRIGVGSRLPLRLYFEAHAMFGRTSIRIKSIFLQIIRVDNGAIAGLAVLSFGKGNLGLFGGIPVSLLLIDVCISISTQPRWTGTLTCALRRMGRAVTMGMTMPVSHEMVPLTCRGWSAVLIPPRQGFSRVSFGATPRHLALTFLLHPNNNPPCSMRGACRVASAEPFKNRSWSHVSCEVSALEYVCVLVLTTRNRRQRGELDLGARLAHRRLGMSFSTAWYVA